MGKRPLSPHLQIYRPQITSVMSILHRLTGILLAFGALQLALWILAAAQGPETFAAIQAFNGSWLGRGLLYGWTAALFYHLANGVRHLLWDAGFGFAPTQVAASGWVTLAVAAALTLLTWLVGTGVVNTGMIGAGA